jgi:hypothetical protein
VDRAASPPPPRRGPRLTRRSRNLRKDAAPAPCDSDEHGSHTAATVAGRPVRGKAVGIAPGSQLASALVIEGGDSVARVLGGLDWALDQGIRVLSMSLGFRGWWEDFLPILLKPLAGLVPPPRSHAIRYYAGFAAYASLRSRIVPRSPRVRRRCLAVFEPEGQLALPLPELKPIFGFGWKAIELVKAPAPRARELDWPSLLRRTFGWTFASQRRGPTGLPLRGTSSFGI